MTDQDFDFDEDEDMDSTREESTEDAVEDLSSDKKDDKKKRPRRKFNASKAVLGMDELSVQMVLESVEVHFDECGRGLPAPVLAEKLCGDKKYAVVILYLVEKHLGGKVEAQVGPGGGLLPAGKKPASGASSAVKAVGKVTDEQIEKINEVLHSCLALRPRGVPMSTVSIKSGIPDAVIKVALPKLKEFSFEPGVGFKYARV